MSSTYVRLWLEDVLVYVVPAILAWEPDADVLASYDGDKVLTWFGELDWTITNSMTHDECEDFAFNAGLLLGACGMVDLTFSQLIERQAVDTDWRAYCSPQPPGAANDQSV